MGSNIYEKEFEAMAKAYSAAGGDPNALTAPGNGSLVIDGNKPLGKSEVDGLTIDAKPMPDGVDVTIKVADGAKIRNPVHLCFGMLPKEGKQVIRSRYVNGKNASADFLSHCIFPNAVDMEHIMDSEAVLAEGAKMSYREEHFHSEKGLVVKPKLRAVLGAGAQFVDEFKLVKGAVGELDLDYEVKQDSESSCELLTKVYGKGTDTITVRESIYLNGKSAGGTAKSRIVLRGSAKAKVLGEVEGNAPYTRGHIDCHEVVEGDGAVAESIPRISVNDPLARITHEAAIGRINKKELETLMSRGLTEDEATDFIVNGLLK